MRLAPSATRLRSGKFAPFAIFSLFIFVNLTGVLASPVLAPPTGTASSETETIPLDVPSSGDPEIDRIIFNAAENEGLDPRFVHAVIWQESKYDANARSPVAGINCIRPWAPTARRFGC